jgi:hypothetical protein
MAYLTLIRVPGDAEDLFQGVYRKMSANMATFGPRHGLISHAAAKTDDGLLIVNIWESKQGSEDMLNRPEVQLGRPTSVVPSEAAHFEQYDIANLEIPD